MKKNYNTPRLMVHGSVSELTQRTSNGARLDFIQNGTLLTNPTEIAGAQAEGIVRVS